MNDYDYGYTPGLKQAQAIVEKYKGKYNYQLSEKEKIELDGALSEIREIQDRCPHSFKLVPMFTQVWQVCERCNYRDLDYNHFK